MADSRKRWDSDDRFTGMADASAFAPAVEELAALAHRPGWVAEDPGIHLAPHLRSASVDGVRITQIRTGQDGVLAVDAECDPGAIGDAGDDLEDCCDTIAALPHTGCRLGDGAKQHPGPPPQFAAAGTGDAFGVDREHAVSPGADLGDPHPVHAGAAQVRHQVDLGLLGYPAGAAGQARKLFNGRGEGARIGYPGEPVVGIPSPAGIHGVCHRPHPWLVNPRAA